MFRSNRFTFLLHGTYYTNSDIKVKVSGSIIITLVNPSNIENILLNITLKMRKLIFCAGFFLSLNFTFAQSAKQNVEKDFINYNQLISDKKIDEALEYNNPKLFEIIPKESMKSLLEAVYKMPNIEYKTSRPLITKISDVKRIENIDYIKIQYISPIEMKVIDLDLNDESKLQALLNSFETKFGKGNVTLDKESRFFKINANKVVIASSSADSINWKFVTVDNSRMKTLLEKIIPSEILD